MGMPESAGRIATVGIEPDFELTTVEKNSPFWFRLNRYFVDSLQQQRERNDSITNDEHKTAVIRGHIEFLKRVIALGEEPPNTDG